MTRNIEKRVEVACPIYQDNLKKQVLDTLEITANDNVKTRLINSDMQNSFLRNSKSNIRSQWYTYTYFKKILNEDSTDSKSEDQPSVVENNQPESVDSSVDQLSSSQNDNKEQNDDKSEFLDPSNEKKMKIKV